MQAFIKDNRLIVNSMIFKDDKAKLLNYIEQMENKNIIPEKLYNVEGEESGIAFELGQEIIDKLNIEPEEEDQVFEGLFKKVEVSAIKVQEKEVVLDFSNSNTMIFELDDNGYIKKITINKDENLVPENIRAGISIEGIEGNLEPDKPDQSKEVIPTTEEQIIRADTGYELASVTVKGVTKNIDNNIKEENIKTGVSILEIDGNFTSDATAVAQDILKDKTAYVNGEKIIGTLEQLDTSDATATANDILEGKTAYVKGEKITGTYEGLSYNDIYDVNMVAKQYQGIRAYIKKLPPSMTIGSTITSMLAWFSYLTAIKDAPELNTENITDTDRMFTYCVALENVPLYNSQKFKKMDNMFQSCNNLTNESLDNILQMCINATSYTGTKKLTTLGLDEYRYNSRITRLPHYQDFLDAGWTIS